MLALSAREIEKRARRVVRQVARRTKASKQISVIDGVSRTGGGSSPGGERPTRLLAISRPGGDAAPLEKRLRAGHPPVIGRMQEGRLLLDLRTVTEEQEPVLVERLCEVLGSDPRRSDPKVS